MCNSTKTRIFGRIAGVRSTKQSVSIIIEENSKVNRFMEDPLLGLGSMEATLLGLGWLMKEGKLLFDNNLISLS